MQTEVCMDSVQVAVKDDIRLNNMVHMFKKHFKLKIHINWFYFEFILKW